MKKTITKNSLNYRVLSDSKMELSQAFGLAFRVDDATIERYKGFGIDLEKSSGEAHHLLPVPAVYVLNTDGKVEFQYVNPDYRIRIEETVLLEAARAAASK